MNGKLKEILDQVQAEEELKDSTKVFLIEKTKGYSKRKTVKHQYHIYAAACVCFLFLLIGGRWLYFTPTAEISIDINPSLELSINRFDRVISLNSFNRDGQKLLDTLDIKYKNYTDAVEIILEHENIAALLSNNEIMTITVTGPDGAQSAKILSNLESCTAAHKNTHCYSASPDDAEAAHEAGLSCGKYRAYLELKELDPDITPEAVQNMTMREIQDLIDKLSAGTGEKAPAAVGENHEHHNSHRHHRRGHR